MLLKITTLTVSSSRLVDGPTRLREAPEGFFRLGGRALQGVAVFGEGRDLGLLGALPRERAAQRAEHEILLVFQLRDALVVLAFVSAQLVEVFARRAERVLPGLGRHCLAARGSRRPESEVCGQLFKLGRAQRGCRGVTFSGQLGNAFMRREAASAIVCVTKQIKGLTFQGGGQRIRPALPDLL